MNSVLKAITTTKNTIKLQMEAFESGYQGSFDALLILNNQFNKYWLQKLAKSASNIVLVDGGANQFFKLMDQPNYKVKILIGDLDSVQPNIRQYYFDQGVCVQQVEDQSFSDFQKALNKTISLGWTDIACLGACGHRLDHTFNNLSIMTKICENNPKISLTLFNEDNFISFIRKDFQNQIVFSSKQKFKECGLITFGKVEHIQTTGLKWNMGYTSEFKSMQWGKFISTSNSIENNIVTIKTTQNLFFICNFQKTSFGLKKGEINAKI